MKKGESYWKWKFNSHLKNWKCFMWLKLKYISHAQAWCSCFVGTFFFIILKMLSFPFWSKQVHKILCGNSPLLHQTMKIETSVSETNKQKKNQPWNTAKCFRWNDAKKKRNNHTRKTLSKRDGVHFTCCTTHFLCCAWISVLLGISDIDCGCTWNSRLST